MIRIKGGLAGIFLILVFLSTTSPARGEAIQRTILNVEKLTCGYCLSQINAKMQTIDGYIGMGANLGRALVGIDHRLTLESGEIAEAITSVGYPASVISESEIDEIEAFSAAGVGSGGCGSRGACGVGTNAQDQEIQGDDNTALLQGNYRRGGCCSLSNRPVRRGGCGGSSSTWQELKRRFSDDSDNGESSPNPN